MHNEQFVPAVAHIREDYRRLVKDAQSGEHDPERRIVRQFGTKSLFSDLDRRAERAWRKDGDVRLGDTFRNKFLTQGCEKVAQGARDVAHERERVDAFGRLGPVD
jgi:hypothetical protein